MAAEIIDLAGYRTARLIELAALMEDDFDAELIEGMAQVYRDKAKTIHRGGLRPPLEDEGPGFQSLDGVNRDLRPPLPRL